MKSYKWKPNSKLEYKFWGQQIFQNDRDLKQLLEAHYFGQAIRSQRYKIW